MSLYNLIHKVDPATFFILPMLDGKHAEEYPRFRDCWVNKRGFEINEEGLPMVVSKNEDEKPENIYIYTRVGGGNREEYEKEIEEMKSHSNYIEDYDDDFDSTYATFVFSVPKEFKEDYDKIIDGDLDKVSENLQKRIREVYPKLEETFNHLWGNLTSTD